MFREKFHDCVAYRRNVLGTEKVIFGPRSACVTKKSRLLADKPASTKQPFRFSFLLMSTLAHEGAIKRGGLQALPPWGNGSAEGRGTRQGKYISGKKQSFAPA